MSRPTISCHMCQKTVYFNEQVQAGDGLAFHERCFKCSVCYCSITKGKENVHEGALFCALCLPKNVKRLGRSLFGKPSGSDLENSSGGSKSMQIQITGPEERDQPKNKPEEEEEQREKEMKMEGEGEGEGEEEEMTDKEEEEEEEESEENEDEEAVAAAAAAKQEQEMEKRAMKAAEALQYELDVKEASERADRARKYAQAAQLLLEAHERVAKNAAEELEQKLRVYQKLQQKVLAVEAVQRTLALKSRQQKQQQNASDENGKRKRVDLDRLEVAVVQLKASIKTFVTIHETEVGPPQLSTERSPYKRTKLQESPGYLDMSLREEDFDFVREGDEPGRELPALAARRDYYTPALVSPTPKRSISEPCDLEDVSPETVRVQSAMAQQPAAQLLTQPRAQSPAQLPTQQSETQVAREGSKQRRHTIGAVLPTLITNRPVSGASNSLKARRRTIGRAKVHPLAGGMMEQMKENNAHEAFVSRKKDYGSHVALPQHHLFLNSPEKMILVFLMDDMQFESGHLKMIRAEIILQSAAQELFKAISRLGLAYEWLQLKFKALLALRPFQSVPSL
eukprot:g64239.t1